MATMVKEKKREKKKVKEKHVPNNVVAASEPLISASIQHVQNDVEYTTETVASFVENVDITSVDIDVDPSICHEQITNVISNDLPQGIEQTVSYSLNLEFSHANTSFRVLEDKQLISHKHNETDISKPLRDEYPGGTYEDLNLKMQRMQIPVVPLNVEQEVSLEAPGEYIKDTNITLEEQKVDVSQDKVLPSAPVFEEMSQPEKTCQEIKIDKEVVAKAKCMSLEEAVWLFGGEAIAEVRVMSEREEAIVEVGPVSGPDHPLVDLLSTLRSSLICLEREKSQLLKSFYEEEKCRCRLWTVEKRTLYLTDTCQCGASVQFLGKYDHAEFQLERLPAARMRLTALLRDVQESYCHHQHSALVAFYQIEDYLSHVVRANKNEMRESLSLILQALKLSDSAPIVLSKLLERWAGMLSSVLVDARDPRQLLFLIHHLFRQSRSVRWASRAIQLNVSDRVSGARALAVLAAMLARPAPDSAVECTEDIEEAWEEVHASGGGGAVDDGALRERDLLSLLRAIPLRSLVANLLLTQADITKAREQDFHDPTGGHGVLRASSGVRALLATFQSARDAHAHYHRLHKILRRITESALQGLAGLHLLNKSSYSAEMRTRIPPELEASFAAGLALFGQHDLHRIPTTLLTENTAREFCMELMFQLHDTTPHQVNILDVCLPPLSCEARVEIVSKAAVLRCNEHELARIVLEFLMQTGLKKKSVPCKGGCEAAARNRLPDLLDAHPYLYTIALHLIADMSLVETLEASCLKYISVDKWRPNTGELLVVLEDWSQRCPSMLQQLMTSLTYTQHCGLSLQSQLTLATWLCNWSRSQPPCEWRWTVLRRLRIHRAAWRLPLDAPDPDPEPDPADLFGTAHALLATSWGHSVPLICARGASALCRLANVRPLDAAHCLSVILLAMAASPDSISLASKFTEFFSVMENSGPGLVQRALGLGGVDGTLLLQAVMMAHLGDDKDPVDYQLNKSMMLRTWLHALWRPVTSPATAALIDTALLMSRDFHTAMDYAMKLTQDLTKDQASQWIKLSSNAPQVVECILRALLVKEEQGGMLDRLLDTLHLQRTANVRINVDAALQQLGTGLKSDSVVIHRASSAAVSAPHSHPAHLMLWRLLVNLWLRRPPGSLPESTPPVGPLFFSGIMKSRTLSSIKRRLQDTIAYHQNEATTYKTLQDSELKPDSSQEVVEKPRENKSDEFPASLSITDFTESSESSDSEESEDESRGVIVVDSSTEEDKDSFHMYCYHVAAEKMLREYLRWLEEGDKARALPYHAEISRFIPEQALHAAWRRVIAQRRPNIECSFPLPTPPPNPPPPQPTVSQRTIDSILMITDRSTQRRRTISLTSALGDQNVSDARALLSLVDKHLQVIERYAREWRSEVSRITSLDDKLLALVRSLRVPRELPPQHVQCANNCKPCTLIPQVREWCISTGVEEGIRENRRSALASVRRLSRPALPVVRAAVALQALARSVGSTATARRVVERAWRGVAACSGCLPAHAALGATCRSVAERWICHDSVLCAELLSSWSSELSSGDSALRLSLCDSLVGVLQLPPRAWPPLYTALLAAPLPPHAAFSYLSKFDVSRWASSLPPECRDAMLSSLWDAATRWGAKPDHQYHILLELIGVHTSALLSNTELCSYIARCARASVACRLPPQHWTHVLRSVAIHAGSVPLDELGHLLRDLGCVWWEARSSKQSSETHELYSLYAPHIAQLLATLQQAFVAAAVALSYAPERVCMYAWSGARESWSPWVQPATHPPLPQAEDMLHNWAAALLHTVLDCAGIEEHLLGEVWEWASNTYLSLATSGNLTDDVTRDQMWSLLRELKQLSFNRPWFSARHVHTALQICRAQHSEIRTWVAFTTRGFSPNVALTRNEAELAPQLAALLCLFTAPNVPYADQTLKEACRLPWHRLPEVALDEALERFFMEHYNLTLSYHEAPHFRVLLSACELIPMEDDNGLTMRIDSVARQKRQRGVAAWQRAASAPKLIAHAPAHATAVLRTITKIAPYLESSPLEVEELLCRAILIMCIEPAGSAVVPVWQKWVSTCPPRLVSACVWSVSSLTALEPFAAVADAAARALLNTQESAGWAEIRQAWARSARAGAAPLCARARAHAAYGAAAARAHGPRSLRAALLALLAADINFIENSVIISTWICLACRTALACSLVTDSNPEPRECTAAATALLSRWAETRRNLLRLVRQQATVPTAEHRILCNLALCVLSPNNESSIRGFESACSSVNPAIIGDAIAWGRKPSVSLVPRLAMRFHPAQEVYFKEELEMAVELEKSMGK